MKIRPVFFLLFCPVLLFAQQKDKPLVDPEAFIERLFPVQEEDLDYEEIYEALFQLYQDPIDLNKADTEELQATYLFSPLQLGNFLAYRAQFGSLISIYELQSIPDFDLPTIHRLLPFVSVDDQVTRPKNFWQRLREEENAYLLVRHRRTWEKRKGFMAIATTGKVEPTTPYLGDANEIYTRFRIHRVRDFSMGFTLEKDAGEQFKWDHSSSRYGFYFASFHLYRQNMGKWKTIALGDFQASFGQGLVFGAGYSLGKGAETVPTIRRSSRGILPYSAALEFGFFRGLGLTRQFRQWQSTLIFSTAPRDGRMNSFDQKSENSTGFISSLLQTGLHRTPAELASKNQLKETNLGGNLAYFSGSGRWSAGINLLFTQFSTPWIRDQTIYNTFEFSGTTNQLGSIYASYNWKNFLFFGESASSGSGGTAAVLGLVSSLSKNLDFSLLWRKYDRDFHSFYSSGFSENTRPINEKGLYLGLQFNPSKIWKINAYFDTFQFPWLKFRVYAPSSGYEWLTRLTYHPRKNLTAHLQVREEKKERNLPDSGLSPLPYLPVPIQKINAALSLEAQPTKNLLLRSRVQWSQVNVERKKSHGLMVFQDIQFGGQNWKLTGRMALFDTEDFDNRLYTFENNVLWTFAIPSFAGRGIRNYLLGQYRISPRFTAYLRYARTTYTDREEISSGLQAIQGNKQTETTFLIRYFLR
jgi:hypothetical protein